jgi:hypothetical protein
MPKEGSFCWTEIASSDADKCQEFYSAVFGWKFKTGDADAGEMDYREFSTDGEDPVGGLYKLDPNWFGANPPPPHFMIYVAVDDIEENAKTATELGATIHKGPMDVPNVGRMCIIEDPTGAKFCTFQMKN